MYLGAGSATLVVVARRQELVMVVKDSISENPQPRIGHVVVVGGSVAGLLAARVLSDHAEVVTIVERDVLPAGPLPRRGVPQSGHTHGLLPGGEAVIERLLPGFGAALVGAGSLELDFCADVAWLTPTGWGARTASPLHVYCC